MADKKNITSAQTVKSARRSGVGQKLANTPADTARLQAQADEQTARLARIAARAKGKDA